MWVSAEHTRDYTGACRSCEVKGGSHQLRWPFSSIQITSKELPSQTGSYLDTCSPLGYWTEHPHTLGSLPSTTWCPVYSDYCYLFVFSFHSGKRINFIDIIPSLPEVPCLKFKVAEEYSHALIQVKQCLKQRPPQASFHFSNFSWSCHSIYNLHISPFPSPSTNSQFVTCAGKVSFSSTF